jgi:hypothetical protein
MPVAPQLSRLSRRCTCDMMRATLATHLPSLSAAETVLLVRPRRHLTVMAGLIILTSIKKAFRAVEIT